MSMSLHELEAFEKFQRETGLVHDELRAAYAEHLAQQKPAPFHKYSKERLERFLMNIYNLVDHSDPDDPHYNPLPPFKFWIGPELRKEIYGEPVRHG